MANDPRQIAYDEFCLRELTGRVVRVLRGNGDLIIESDIPLVHPDLDKPTSRLYGGVPNDPAFREGERVAFRLKPRWSWKSKKPNPNAVDPDTVRLLEQGEPRPDFSDLEQLIRDVSQVGQLEKVVTKLKAEAQELRAQQELAEAAVRSAELQADRVLQAADEERRSREDALAARQQEHKAAVAEFEERGGKRFMEAVNPEAHVAPRVSQAIPPAPGLVGSLQQCAAEAGLTVDDALLRRILVGHVVSALTGDLLVYGGPPGSGKTTMATWMPEALDMAVEVLPVRPGWLDSVDLLGFYDPRNERFARAPFLDFVFDARRDEPAGVEHVVVLDELNIARIENYGADLLSQVEKAHEPSGAGYLRLYSPLIQRERDRQLNEALEQGRSPDLQAAATPAIVPIPKNLIIAGTLNNDDSTENLSPKVLDRSLAVRCPVRQVQLPVAAQSGQAPVVSLDRRLTEGMLTLAGLLASIEVSGTESDGPPADAGSLWATLTGLLDEFSIPSVHLSHRLARAVKLVPAVAETFHLAPTDVLDDVVCMKVLPWVRFFRSDAAAEAELEQLGERAADEGLDQTSQEIRDLLDSSDELVQYLR